MDEVILVFTPRGKDKILKAGGSGSWVLNKNRADKAKYIICIQNREPKNTDRDWGELLFPHQSAFLIGHISGIKPIKKRVESRVKRWIIKIDEYADIDIPNIWTGNRNPVAYELLDDLQIDINRINFKKIPDKEAIPNTSDNVEYEEEIMPLTIKEAIKRLSKSLGVSEDKICITIRG